MPRTLARYLAVEVLPLAALANVLVNAAAGRALYPARVPLGGPHGLGGDTLATAFLIGFFTLALVMPAARREARAGRLVGRGRRWLGWPARHPLPSALGFGLVTALALGLPFVAALAARGVTLLGRADFVALKAGFAGATGVVTAIAAALVGVGGAPAAGADPRWCRDAAAPVGGPVYPCDYIDKGGLAVTSRAHGCSGTPTWQLVVAGALDPAHVRTALADTVTRYPSLATRVQALDGVPALATRFRYAWDPAFRVDDVFEAVDLRGDAAGLGRLTRALHDRHLDLFTDFPLTLTLARTGDEGCRLFFRQHHAIADGHAFIDLLADFAGFLEAARAGRRPPPEALAPIGRRGELEALGLGRARRVAWTLAGYGWLLGALGRALLRPVVPLLQNRSNDYTGENGTVHWSLPDDVLAGWNAARKRLGVSLNSLLTAALLRANQRLHRARGLPLGRTAGTLVMETRPRDGSFRSFANHLATIDVEAPLDRLDDPVALARRVQAQVDRQRAASTPLKRLLCERQLVARMPLEQLQRLVFESKRPTYNLNFSNLLALPFPRLGGDGWAVEEVLITTPVTPRSGIVLTAIRYGGRVVFNFNYKASAVSREDTEALRAEFEGAIGELTAPR